MAKINDLSLAASCGNELQRICHERAAASGWWTNLETGTPYSPQDIRKMVPNKLMLTVSELAEAMEADRKGLKDSHLPHRDGVEVELADAAIRIFDLAGALGFDLGSALAEKLAYNAKREDHKLAARAGTNGKAY